MPDRNPTKAIKQLSDSVINLYKPFSDFRLSAPLVLYFYFIIHYFFGWFCSCCNSSVRAHYSAEDLSFILG
jgi:hypothetical protein